MALNEKQKRFVEEYFKDYNGVRAYQEAYPNSSYDTAKVNASKLLTNTNIREYLQELKDNVAEIAGFSKLTVLNEIKDILQDENPEAVTAANKLKALEIVNKMLGFNDPEKKDITSGGKSISPIDWAE